jgi:hypothetical protein
LTTIKNGFPYLIFSLEHVKTGVKLLKNDLFETNYAHLLL